METSKDYIINKIKTGKSASVEHPAIPQYVFEGDKLESFKRNLIAFSGKYHQVKDYQEIEEYIQHHFHGAKKIVSNFNGYAGNVAINDLTEPRAAADLDLAVIRGVMGVAETGSVWVTDRELKINSIGLLALHLVLILDANLIVGNLHDAYNFIAKEDLPGYGVFFTGPSATADIEAIHINGAQGVLSLTVLVLI